MTRFSSPAGRTLRKAAVMDIIRPGVVGLPHGAWLDVDEETGIDRGGCVNYLSGAPVKGSSVSAYNSINVKITKWEGEPLIADVDKPRTIYFE